MGTGLTIDSYSRNNWQNGRLGRTPITAEKLRIIENGIYTNRDYIKTLNTELNACEESLESVEEGLQSSAKALIKLDEKVQDCFQSVSDGKRKVAAAITGKGVRTEAAASFDVMAANIKRLPTGGTKNTVKLLVISETKNYVPESGG